MEPIKLRHVEIGDYKGIKKYIINSEVARYLTWQSYKNEDQILRYFNRILKTRFFPDETLVIDYNNEVIGTVHFLFRKNTACAQFGFGILPEYWNKGIGNQVVKLSLKHFLETDWLKNSQALWADTHYLNGYAIRILLKNGFSLSKKRAEDNRDRYSILYESK